MLPRHFDVLINLTFKSGNFLCLEISIWFQDFLFFRLFVKKGHFSVEIGQKICDIFLDNGTILSLQLSNLENWVCMNWSNSLTRNYHTNGSSTYNIECFGFDQFLLFLIFKLNFMPLFVLFYLWHWLFEECML